MLQVRNVTQVPSDSDSSKSFGSDSTELSKREDWHKSLRVTVDFSSQVRLHQAYRRGNNQAWLNYMGPDNPVPLRTAYWGLHWDRTTPTASNHKCPEASEPDSAVCSRHEEKRKKLPKLQGFLMRLRRPAKPVNSNSR